MNAYTAWRIMSCPLWKWRRKAGNQGRLWRADWYRLFQPESYKTIFSLRWTMPETDLTSVSIHLSYCSSGWALRRKNLDQWPITHNSPVRFLLTGRAVSLEHNAVISEVGRVFFPFSEGTFLRDLKSAHRGLSNFFQIKKMFGSILSTKKLTEKLASDELSNKN